MPTPQEIAQAAALGLPIYSPPAVTTPTVTTTTTTTTGSTTGSGNQGGGNQGGGGGGGGSGGGNAPAPTTTGNTTFTLLYNTQTGTWQNVSAGVQANAPAGLYVATAPSTGGASGGSTPSTSGGSTTLALPPGGVPIISPPGTTWIPRSDLPGGGFWRAFVNGQQLDFGAGANATLNSSINSSGQTVYSTSPITTAFFPVYDSQTGRTVQASTSVLALDVASGQNRFRLPENTIAALQPLMPWANSQAASDKAQLKKENKFYSDVYPGIMNEYGSLLGKFNTENAAGKYANLKDTSSKDQPQTIRNLLGFEATAKETAQKAGFNLDLGLSKVNWNDYYFKPTSATAPVVTALGTEQVAGKLFTPVKNWLFSPANPLNFGNANAAAVPQITSGSPEQSFLFSSGMAYGAGLNTTGTGYNTALSRLGNTDMVNPNPSLQGVASQNVSSSQKFVVPKGATMLEALSITNAAAKDANARFTSSTLGAGTRLDVRVPGDYVSKVEKYSLPQLSSVQLSSMTSDEQVKYWSDRGYSVSAIPSTDAKTGEAKVALALTGISNQDKFLANNPDAQRMANRLASSGGTGITFDAKPSDNGFTFTAKAENIGSNAELIKAYEENHTFMPTGQYTIGLPKPGSDIVSQVVRTIFPIAGLVTSSREVPASKTQAPVFNGSTITIPAGQYYSGKPMQTESGERLSYPTYLKLKAYEEKPFGFLPSSRQRSEDLQAAEKSGDIPKIFTISAVKTVQDMAGGIATSYPSFYSQASGQLQAGRAYSSGNYKLGDTLVSQKSDVLLGSGPVLETGGAFLLFGGANKILPSVARMSGGAGTETAVKTFLSTEKPILGLAGVVTAAQIAGGTNPVEAAGVTFGGFTPFIAEPLMKSRFSISSVKVQTPEAKASAKVSDVEAVTKAKTPAYEPQTTVYRGVFFKGVEGEATPLIGVPEKGGLSFGQPKVSTMPSLEKAIFPNPGTKANAVNLQSNPATSEQTVILSNKASMERMKFTENDISKDAIARQAIKGIVNAKNEFVMTEFPKLTKALNAKDIDATISLAQEFYKAGKIEKMYGSFTEMGQRNPGYTRTPGDIEIQFRDKAGMREFAEKAAQRYRDLGHKDVSVETAKDPVTGKEEPSGSVMVDKVHALDLHYNSEPAQLRQVIGESEYGFSKNRPTFVFQGLPTQTINEQIVNRGGAATRRFTLSTGENVVEPALHRGKEIPDSYAIMKTFKQDALAEKWRSLEWRNPDVKSLFSELDATVAAYAKAKNIPKAQAEKEVLLSRAFPEGKMDLTDTLGKSPTTPRSPRLTPQIAVILSAAGGSGKQEGESSISSNARQFLRSSYSSKSISNSVRSFLESTSSSSPYSSSRVSPFSISSGPSLKSPQPSVSSPLSPSPLISSILSPSPYRYSSPGPSPSISPIPSSPQSPSPSSPSPSPGSGYPGDKITYPPFKPTALNLSPIDLRFGGRSYAGRKRGRNSAYASLYNVMRSEIRYAGVGHPTHGSAERYSLLLDMGAEGRGTGLKTVEEYQEEAGLRKASPMMSMLRMKLRPVAPRNYAPTRQPSRAIVPRRMAAPTANRRPFGLSVRRIR